MCVIGWVNFHRFTSKTDLKIYILKWQFGVNFWIRYNFKGLFLKATFRKFSKCLKQWRTLVCSSGMNGRQRELTKNYSSTWLSRVCCSRAKSCNFNLVKLNIFLVLADTLLFLWAMKYWWSYCYIVTFSLTLWIIKGARDGVGLFRRLADAHSKKIGIFGSFLVHFFQSLPQCVLNVLFVRFIDYWSWED